MSTPPNFIRVYHLTTLEHAKSDIQFHRLKVATFEDANDPFELLALNCRGRSNREARHLLRQFKQLHADKMGMLCFSRSWSDPVLWSHYADKHKGVSLGFDVREDLIDAVSYEPELLRANLSDDDDTPTIPEDVEDRLFVTKFRHWQYEDEVRRFVELSAAQRHGTLYFWPFDEEMRLREVVLGARCPIDELEPIRALARSTNPGVLVSVARLGFGSFRVLPNKRYPAGA